MASRRGAEVDNEPTFEWDHSVGADQPVTHLAIQLRQLPRGRLKRVLKQVIVKVPGGRKCLAIRRVILNRPSAGGVRTPRTSELAPYNYGVWLRHMIEAQAQGLPCEPLMVCEIGPGKTIGTGLAALISGADRYIAIDGKWAWDTAKNVAMFDDLVALFRRRDARDASGGGLPQAAMLSDEFPAHVLSDSRMERCLDPARLGRIRESIARVNRDDSCIRYILQKNGDPMHELDGTADMIFSQAALEHVGELSLAYERMSRWLVPGGFVSHQIDFQCHGAARDWNGHWAYSDPVWKLIYLGTEPLINRVPCSEHLRLMRHHGFESVAETRRQDGSGIAEPMLATRFRGMSADDLTTRGVFVQAVMRRRQQNGPEFSS